MGQTCFLCKFWFSDFINHFTLNPQAVLFKIKVNHSQLLAHLSLYAICFIPKSQIM